MQFEKILIIFLIMSFLTPLLSSTQSSLGTFKQNDCIELIQTCENCSYVNISAIYYPNSTLIISEIAMTKSDTVYNYTFCDTSVLGEYKVNGYGDEDGIKEIFVYTFEITSSGENLGLSQGIVLLAQMGVMALFFALGRVFGKEKWKIKLFFDLISLLMAIILLNSIRIIISQSENLKSMGETGLILGMIVLLFLFLYTFIYALIEVFRYFRNKKEMRWRVS